MLKLKKTMAALLALGSCSVFAGTMGPTCLAGNVTVPCEKTGWEVGGQALYLQPIYSMAGSTPKAVFGASDNYGYTLYPQPSWAWGFMIDGAYHWGMGKDLTLSWYHVNHATVLANQPFQDGSTGTPQPVVNMNLSLHPQWDAANAEFGRRIDLDQQSNLRFFGGVQYARIVNQSNGYIATGDTSGFAQNGVIDNNTYLKVNSNFNGFGPRGGLDLNYELPYGFTAYAKGAGGLLVGSAGFTNDRLGLLGGSGFSANTGSRTMLVPELEGKLGFKYHHQMPAWTKQTSPSELTLDAGWMWVNYFEANMFGTNESGRANDVAPNRVDVSQTSFALQGLYFGLNWLGNM